MMILSDVKRLLAPGVHEFDTTKLTNPSGSPMWLDEISFALSRGGYGSTIRAAFTLDRVPLTGGYVPVWNFGRMLNTAFEETNDGPNNGMFVWRLPKPLYIPAGKYLAAKIWHTGLPDVKTCDFRMTYYGRAISSSAPVPKRIPIPWVTSFVGNVVPTAADTTDKSADSDLCNPFDVPLFVQRFIGRAISYEGSAGSPPNEVKDAFVDEFSRAVSELITIRAFDHRGRILVRDYTPLAALFSESDKSWTVNAKLAPKGFYRMMLSEALSALTVGYNIRPMISMVGYRMTELQ